MGNNKTIHVKKSGGIYYKAIQKSNGSYDIRKIDGLGFLSSDRGSIGKVNSLSSAMDLVRSYSGKEIREIKDA